MKTLFIPIIFVCGFLVHNRADGQVSDSSLETHTANKTSSAELTVQIQNPPVQDSLDLLDPWLGFDKVQHFTFSFMWVLSTQYVMVNKAHFKEAEVYPVSVLSGAAVGIMKEVYDARKPGGRFSKRDLIADSLGLLLASIVIWVDT